MSHAITLPALSTTLRDKALEAISKLPPFSPVLNKLMASLADDNISFAELAAVIEKDTVLAGSVLRLVNSAFYARRGTVNSVKHAVSVLGIGKLRGTMHTLGTIPVLCTFHPAYLLRDETKKKDCWDDMKMLLSVMGRPIPGKS